MRGTFPLLTLNTSAHYGTFRLIEQKENVLLAEIIGNSDAAN